MWRELYVTIDHKRSIFFQPSEYGDAQHADRSASYDAVGNRKQLTSTLAPVPTGLWNYDATTASPAGDTYDANGNTTSSGGIADAYDFENHLVQKGGVTLDKCQELRRRVSGSNCQLCV